MNGADPLEEALALLGQGRAPEAAAALEAACRERPEAAAVWTLLGMARHQAGQLAAAQAALDTALRLEPHRLDALQALCAVLYEAGQAEAALAAARRGLAVAPADPVLLTSLGILMEDRGEEMQAQAAYDAALAAAPDWLPALLNRGALHSRSGRHLQALADAQRLAAVAPGAPEAHANRAESLLALGRYGEALAAAERALQLRPGWEEARAKRGVALAALGRLSEAASVLAGLPQAPDARAVYLNRGLARQASCDWHDRAEFVARFEELVDEGHARGRPLEDASLGFPSLALPLGPGTRLALMQGISAAVAQRAAALPPLRRARVPRGDGRLRLGYLSPSVYRHPNAYLTRFLYRLHDRERFAVHCFSLHPGDDSAVCRDIRKHAEHFHHLAGRPPQAVAQAIADAGIDVLVDLGCYSRGALPEIPALRPAPLQVGFLGFPGTSGSAFLDYYVVDAVVAPPGSERYWSEALLRLPASYFPYDDAQTVAAAPGRGDCGLPEDGFVFCCFNAAYKIEPEAFAVWMRLLQRVPRSVLWLMGGGDAVRRNLQREAERRGVDAARLVFAGHVEDLAQHLARYRLADLFLDTFVFGAHTTAVDALWAGLPVLTVPGTPMASRVGASLLRAAGLPELVAADAADYEARAVDLATRPDALGELRQRRAARADAPVFDSVRYVRGLEASYEAIWARCQAGAAPAAFSLASG